MILVIGAGYVGLPLSIAFAKHGKVHCYDINKKLIEQLRLGIDENNQHLKNEILNNNLIDTQHVYKV